METLNLNVRVNTNDKKEFELFCNSVGLNVSTAINLFIKKVLREQRIPFEIGIDTFDENVYDKLKEAELEIENTSVRYTKEDILDSMNNIIG